MKYFDQKRYVKAKSKAVVLGATLALFAFVFFTGTLHAQKGEIEFLGLIKNIDTQEPVKNQQVKIQYRPSSSFTTPPVTEYITTNHKGFYHLRIETPSYDLQVNISTYDCEYNEFDSTFYIEWGGLQTRKFRVDFEICHFIECYADFSYLYDTATSFPYIYQFYDKSAESVTKRKWSFGDGSASLDKNPVHYYSEPGIYEVTLLTTTSESFDEGCVDSTMQVLSINPEGYYSFGGQIFAGNFPVEVAEVYLYKKEDELIVPVDTTLVDTVNSKDGNYYFYWMPEGDYIVKAAPIQGTSIYGDYFQTYFGDVVFWDEAHTIGLYQQDPSNYQHDVHLTSLAQANSGQGKISGYVSYYDQISSPSPLSGIEVIITDENGDYLNFNFSNDEGKYFFEGLDWGDYTIKPDMTGTELLEKQISLSESNPVDSVDILILGPDTTAQSVFETGSAYLKNMGDIYPNPASTHASFNVMLKQNSAFTIKIYNQTGQQIYQKRFTYSGGEHQIPVNISNLNNGFYSLQLLTEDNRSFVKKLIITK